MLHVLGVLEYLLDQDWVCGTHGEVRHGDALCLHGGGDFGLGVVELGFDLELLGVEGLGLNVECPGIGELGLGLELLGVGCLGLDPA